jgi:hypothetical protein
MRRCLSEKRQYKKARVKVLTAASMNFSVFSDASSCSHVEVDRRFRGAYCLHYGLLKRRSIST